MTEYPAGPDALFKSRCFFFFLFLFENQTGEGCMPAGREFFDPAVTPSRPSRDCASSRGMKIASIQ